MTYTTEWTTREWEIDESRVSDPTGGDVLAFQGQGKDDDPGSVERERGGATTSDWARECKHQTTGEDRVYLRQAGKDFTVFRKDSVLECWPGHLTAVPIARPDEQLSGASWTAQEGG